MKQTVIRSCLCLAVVLTMALATAVRPASATNIGTLSAGSSYSDTISSNGPTFSRDYNFHLNSTITGMTILATAISQSKAGYGVDSMTASLYDSSSNLIATASGSPLIGFDSFAQSGIALGAGDYLFSILGNVTPGMKAFVSISLAANTLNAQTPIPASGLMLFTGLVGLGGFALRRRRSAGPPSGLAA